MSAVEGIINLVERNFDVDDQDSWGVDGDKASAELAALRSERDTLAAIVERIAVSVRGTNDYNHMTQLDTLPDNVDELIEMWRTAQDGALSDEIRADRLEAAANNLIDYRDRNTLNFQLEKADDYINVLRALCRATKQAQPDTLTARNCVACRHGRQMAVDSAATLADELYADEVSDAIRAMTPPESCEACNPLAPTEHNAATRDEFDGIMCQCVCGCTLQATRYVDGMPSCDSCDIK